MDRKKKQKKVQFSIQFESRIEYHRLIKKTSANTQESPLNSNIIPNGFGQPQKLCIGYFPVHLPSHTTHFRCCQLNWDVYQSKGTFIILTAGNFRIDCKRFKLQNNLAVRSKVLLKYSHSLHRITCYFHCPSPVPPTPFPFSYIHNKSRKRKTRFGNWCEFETKRIQFLLRADENQKNRERENWGNQRKTEQRANHRDCLTRGSIGRYAPDSLLLGGRHVADGDIRGSCYRWKGFSCLSHCVSFFYFSLEIFTPSYEFLVNWISMFREQDRQREIYS